MKRKILVVQIIGRSVRGKSDYADVYILDGYIKQIIDILPDSIKCRLQIV